MANIPPTITTPPDGPQRGDRATFAGRVDAFITWLIASVAQFGAVASNVYANAVDAFTSATAAGASASAASAAAESASQVAGATKWVSGTTYADGACVWSPLNSATYRRRSTGGGTTDPSADSTNWGVPITNGFTNIAVITTTQAWVCPAGTTKAEVTVVDGGHSGNGGTGGLAGDFLNGGNGGNSGATVLTLTPGTSYTGTIGSGGAGSNGISNPGGSTSFSGAGIATITSANATLKIPGGKGEAGGGGGYTYGPVSGGGTLYAAQGSAGYGAGGQGGSGTNPGGSGKSGVIIIRY